MKALSLHQPYASLIVLGAKHIETRSWTTRYRGELAIHAAVKPVAPGELGAYCFDRNWIARHEGHDGYTGAPIAEVIGDTMPYGVVVAICNLVDVIPIDRHASEPGGDRVGDFPHDGPLAHQRGGLWVVGPRIPTNPTYIEDQRPYGDFSAGRWAWMLEDVVPLEVPVAAVGKQRLWEWEVA